MPRVMTTNRWRDYAENRREWEVDEEREVGASEGGEWLRTPNLYEAVEVSNLLTSLS